MGIELIAGGNRIRNTRVFPFAGLVVERVTIVGAGQWVAYL